MAELAVGPFRGGAGAEVEPGSPVLHPHQLAVCGYSGSGKTTLLEKLISALSSEYRMGYVKHDAHGFQMDRPGKDTYRAAEAGAVEVLINDPGRTAHLTMGPMGLFEAGYALLDCDWLFIEGYKNSALPKILVLDAAGRAEREWREGKLRNVVACVGPAALAEDPPAPYFQRDDVHGLCELVRRYWGDVAARVPLYGLVLAGSGGQHNGCGHHAAGPRDQGDAAEVWRLAARYCERAYLSLPDSAAADASRGIPRIDQMFQRVGPAGEILSAMYQHPSAAWLVVDRGLQAHEEEAISGLIEQRSPFRFATSRRGRLDGGPDPRLTLYEPKSRLRLVQALGMGRTCVRTMLMNARIMLVPNDTVRGPATGDRPHDPEGAPLPPERVSLSSR